MKILIATTHNFYQNKNLLSLSKALHFLGHNVVLWDRNLKPALDLFAEFKPELYIFNPEEVQNAEQKAIEKYNPKLFDSYQIYDCADVFLYKAVKPEHYFECDVMSILYEKEDTNGILGLLDIRSEKKYKLFTPFQLSFQAYCGWLSEEYHSILLSSASSVHCTNTWMQLNYTLANPKSVLLNQTLPQSVIYEKYTCFHEAEKLTDFDVTKTLERCLNDSH